MEDYRSEFQRLSANHINWGGRNLYEEYYSEEQRHSYQVLVFNRLDKKCSLHRNW